MTAPNRPSVLVRHGQGLVHTARPRRPLLPDGRLSFHDVPICGIRGTSWRPAGDLRMFTRTCRRCEAVLQRERSADLAALLAAGRAQLERAALLELVRGWSDPTSMHALRMAVIELRDPEVRSALRKTSERLQLTGPATMFRLKASCGHKRCQGGYCMRRRGRVVA